MTVMGNLYSILSKYLIPSFSYVGEVFCIFSVIFIMISFLGCEGKVTRWTFIPGIVYIIIIAVMNILFADHDLSILYTVLLFVTAIFISRYTFTKKWILNCIVATLMLFIFETYISCEMLCTAMYFSNEPKSYVKGFSGFKGYMGTGFSNIFIMAYLSVMLIIFSALYFGMIKKQRTIYVGWYNRIFFILWEVLMICIMWVPVWVGVTEKMQVKYMGYELGIIMLVMGIIFPFLIITIISRRYALEKTLIQEDYISAELDYINQYKKNQTETRAFRHDIINNLSLLSAMHDEKKYDEIEDYLGSLLGSISSMSPKYITGDEMLNCIVGMKSAKMEEEGIDFSVDGFIEGGFGMKPVDVCGVFANALDNAIEACEKIPEEKERWIRLSIKETGDTFQVILQNTMGEDRVVSKKDKGLHGYGIQNMKATIRRYEGTGKVDKTDGIFTLSINIPKSKV